MKEVWLCRASPIRHPRATAGRNGGGGVLRNWQLYVLLLPALLYLYLFCYVPMYGVQLAFKQYKPRLGIVASPFIGMANFTKFFQSYFLGELIRNTIVLSVQSLLIGFPIPIVLALLLNQLSHQRYKSTIQTIVYAPHFISVVVLVGMLNIFLSPYNGFINKVIEMMGGSSINFIGRPDMFRGLYVWSGIWQGSGFAMIVYLATLTAVDPSLHEAAAIDGANKMQRIVHIDLPTIMPTIVIMFILSLGGIMNVGFEKVYLLQNDMNLETSEIIATYVYKRGLLDGDMGFSTAVNLFNTVINSTLLIFFNGVSRRIGQASLF